MGVIPTTYKSVLGAHPPSPGIDPTQSSDGNQFWEVDSELTNLGGPFVDFLNGFELLQFFSREFT